MRVFVLPSWWPSERHGLITGSFVRESVAALQRTGRVQLAVSLTGQGSHEFSSARLRAWLAQPWPRGARPPRRREVAPGWTEYSRPAWSARFAWRGAWLPGLLRAHRANLAQAIAEQGRPDLLHAHVAWPAGWVAMRLSQETGIPYVVTEHMSPFPFTFLKHDGGVVPEVAEPLRGARAVFAVGRALAARIADTTGVRAEVMPNGVDGGFFTPGRGQGEGFTFLTVASLQPQKGIDDLLRAVATLGPLPGVRFRVLGAGPCAEEYRALAASLGVADRIEWLGAGSREQVRDALRDCDAFVLASRHESFGVVVAEALACGRPVVATRSGGPEDLVGEDDGILVSVGDVSAIADALRAVATGARTFDAAGIRARFEARFEASVVAERLLERLRASVGVA